MKRNTFTRTLSGFLSVLMVLSVLVFSPITASAAVTRQQAVAAALAQVGSSFPANSCLKHVADFHCYTLGFTPRSSSCCAYNYGSSYIDSTSSSNIPLGADIYFGGSNVFCSGCKHYAGHVGVYVGNGYVVHAWSGRIVKTTVQYVINCGYPYRGWGWHANNVLPDGSTPSIPIGSFTHANIVEGHYIYKNYESGRCLNVPGNGDTSLTALTIFTADGTTGQNFNTQKASNGYYTLSPECSTTGKVVNINGSNAADGSIVSIYSSTGDDTQQWVFEKTNAGYYIIHSVDNPSYVLAETGTTSGSSIVVQAYTGNANQLWTLTPTSGGTTPDVVYVHYNNNGGTGAPVSQEKTSNNTITLSSAVPTKSGFRFIGWGFLATETVPSYQPGDSYSESETHTLYALWGDLNYTLTLNANGGNGTTSVTKQYNESVYLGSYTPTRSGYTFLGWATSASGSASYDPTDTYTAATTTTLYAVWRQNTYTINYYANGGSGAPGAATVTAGSQALSSTVPTRSGYTFLGWAPSASATTATYSAGQTISVSGNLNLYAVWRQNTVTITYNANGGSGAPGSATVVPGSQTLSGTVPTRSGYNFLGWATSSSATAAAYSAGQTITISGNLNLYAVWSQITYTITYYANGGSGAPAAVTVAPGSRALSATVPTRSGYSFLGWATSSSATAAAYTAGQSVTISGNLNLYAVWSQITYTITYYANNGSGAPAAATVAPGSRTLSSTIPTRSGYSFLGWATSSSATAATYSAGQAVLISGNLNLYAVWSQITYTITYYANGGSGAPAAATVAPGSRTLSATVPTRSGYSFLGWATSSTATAAAYTAGQTITVGGNLNLYAVWKLITYTITYNANSGSGAPSSITVAPGSTTLSATVPTRSGYRFLGWSTSSSATVAAYAAGQNITLSGNLNLYAVWSLITYTITYNANGGSGAPAAITVVPGSAKLSTTVLTRSGYSFLGWATSSTATAATYTAGQTISVSENMNLYAVWKLITYTITYHANSGSGAPAAVTVVPGSKTLSETVPTRSGYSFLGWATSSTATAAAYTAGQTITVSGNMNLYAVWSEIGNYSVQYISNGTTDKRDVALYDSIELPIPAARTGYRFDGWRSAQDHTLYPAGTGFIIFENMVFTAEWTKTSTGPQDTTVTFGHSMMLENRLSMVILVKESSIPADADLIYLEINREDLANGGRTETEILISDVASGGAYRFYYNGIAAAEMTANCYATLHYTYDGIFYSSQQDVISAKSWAESQLEKAATAANLKTLLVDMLNYGAAAQAKFNLSTKLLANAGIDAYQNLGTTSIPTFTNVRAASGTGLAIATNLQLENAIEMVFKVPKANADSVGCTTDNMVMKITRLDTGDVTEITCSNVETSAYVFNFRGMATSEFGEGVTAQLYRNGEMVSIVRTFSIESYLAGQYETSDTNTQAMFIAMKRFSDAAAAYFG